ncbi:unnamed protein product [Mytilus edulis]|uniref:Uncharacterized protein n=1 Tax=Mytilus edulis TaxID=6550 RepID=A0A8S3V4K9_MYTED|nr:unnamed protein product [Mytilus edulis]
MTRTLDELMVKAVFSGDPNVVQLFVNRGFNVNATFLRITVLKWAEYLAYDDVCKVLESRKAFRKNDNGYPILVCLINHGVFRRMSYLFPSIDPLPIIHQACESESDVLDMIYDVTSNHLNANKEELLTNNLLRTSIGKSEEDLAKYVDWIGKPQSLKNICRRFFRSTYRVAKYVVFLKSIKTVVPASIHNYLSMQDFLEFLLPDSELKEIEEKTKNAEKYVLKCSPDHYEFHDSN